MALRLDVSPRDKGSTLEMTKVFLLGFFVGETCLLILFGILSL